MKFENAPFFQELNAIIEAQYASPFFDELELGAKAERDELERIERQRLRRLRNGPKALQTLQRLRKVQAIDLFEMTNHIPADFFDNKTNQFQRVKELFEKKSRLIWYLQGLYMYLMFDVQGKGWWVRKRGIKYSKHRAHWYKLLEAHKYTVEEERKRVKWELKRLRVKKQREKQQKSTLEKVYHLRMGLGNKPV